MAKAVRRSLRPLAVAVLLAALQTPLCAMTCLAAADGAAEPMEAHRAASHCPEATPRAPAALPDPSDAATPADPANRHGDCRCDGVQAVGASSADAGPPALAVVARSIVAPARAAHGPAQLATGSETDLPPPDLLLLHSILLI